MPQKIRIAQWGYVNMLYLPVYLAIEGGFFAKHGLDIELVFPGNDDEVFAAVAKGKAELGLGDPTFCALKKNAKHDVKMLATIMDRIGTWGFTSNPVIPVIKDKDDMVNLRIGTYPSPATGTSILKNLKASNKRLLRSMQIIEAPIGKQFGLLASGKADIVIDIEPFVSMAESKGCKVVYSFSKLHGPFAFTGLVAKNEFLEGSSERTKAILDGVKKGFKALENNPALVAKTCAKYFPDMDEAVLKKATARLLKEHSWPKNIKPSPASWMNAIKTHEGIGDVFVDDPLECLYVTA